MPLRYNIASPLSLSMAGVCLHVLSRRIIHIGFHAHAAPETMPSIPYVSGRAWRRAHHIQLKDDGAFQETCHDEEIQAQQSPETAASPPASTATDEHTTSFDTDTPRERQPSCHDHDRRNPATHASALRGLGRRTTPRPLRLVALSGIRREPDAVGVAVYGGSTDLTVQRPACCPERGLRSWK